MVNYIVEQHEAIFVVLASNPKTSHAIPTWQDFHVLNPMLTVLSPLHEMMNALSGEKSVSISAMIKPLLAHIKMLFCFEVTMNKKLNEREAQE